MTTVDKTVAILSTVHGFVSDESQCEALREHLRAISVTRDVAFTIHEIAMRAVGTSGTAVDKEVRVRTITEDASMCSIRFVNNVKIASAVETREVTDTQASANAEVWLTQIGFVYCFEFFKEGFRYGVVLDGGREALKPMFVHIFVYKLKKFTERGNFNNVADMTPGYMVELQCEEDAQTKDFGVRLLNFAKALSPHIYLQEGSTR